MSLSLHEADHGAACGPGHAPTMTVWYMVARHARMITLGLVTVVSGCSVANQLNPLAGMSGLLPTKPPPDQIIGPDSAFTVRTPQLIMPQGRVSTQRAKTGEWSATFDDRMCTGFVVTVFTDSSGTSLEELVRTRARPAFEHDGAVEITQRTDTLEMLGEAIFMRYRMPKGAPCEMQQISGGLMLFPKSKKPDADIAHYIFQHRGMVFDALFVRPSSGASAGGRNPDAVLREFVTGITFAR